MDATFKYNNLPHSSTKQIPYNAWHKNSSTFNHVTPFAQYGTVVNGNVQGKMAARSESVQYMYPVDQNHFQVRNINTGKKHKVRAANFKPYHKHLDTAILPLCIPKAFKVSAAAYKRRAPTTITTPAPVNTAMAGKYPDGEHWATAHDKELDQLDSQKVAIWCYTKADLQVGAIVIPLTMHYIYKRNNEGIIAA